jgi:hypothetical protein
MLLLATEGRDARCINHMDPDTRLIHARLERWAQWARGGLEGLDWPRETLLGRMMTQGITGASQTGRPPISMPEDVSITDIAVGKLGEIDKEVIRVYYLSWAPESVLWKQCSGIRSLSYFRAVLKRARWRLIGYIDGWYK